MTKAQERIRCAEFFAGVGLVGMALERVGCEVVFANDIDQTKQKIYAQNFPASRFRLGDVCDVRGADLPQIDVATSSFPCTDLSLAGNRAGLAGPESSLLWQFLRIIDELGDRRPRVVMIENVLGFATSRDGRDLLDALKALNRLGYGCDLVTLDAAWFVPQSRPRLFIVGSQKALADPAGWVPSRVRPAWIGKLVADNPGLTLQAAALPDPPSDGGRLSQIVTRTPARSSDWWDVQRLGAFLASLSPLQADRLNSRIRADQVSWATAYRRTRGGRPVWEVRADDIAGCLRTTGGGSSKQALVEAGRGNVRVRWLSGVEYARLQGAGDLRFGDATESQIRFAFGDAVCVPAVTWLAEHYLLPLANGTMTRAAAACA